MTFIKRKNLIEREEILYTPILHWMYLIKQPFVILLLIPVLYIAQAGLSGFFPSGLSSFLSAHSIKLTLVIIIIAFPSLAWRIFLYLSVEYGVTNKRLLMKKGILRVFTAEIPMDRIESIYCVQGLLGKLFNYGTICISGIGGRMPVFFMVTKPYALRRKIVGIIEKNKTITVVHSDPPKPPPPPPVAKPEPDYGTYVKLSLDCQKQAAPKTGD